MSNITRTVAPFETDEEVLELVRRFEACETAPDDFKHREHLAIALVYVLRPSEEDAHARIRRAILRFLESKRLDASVYNETVTRFWLKRVRAYVESSDATLSLRERANALVAQCGDSSVIYEYYGKALIDSDAARAGWIEPDLKALDF